MGSSVTQTKAETFALLETSCGYLLEELQMIWDEVGEDQPEREKILLELQQECLEVYRRKVDRANILRAQLHQELAVSEAELTHLLLLLGERSLPGRPERMAGTLKERLKSITPGLKEMQLRKEERIKQFRAVQGQIQKISAQIAGESEYKESTSNLIIDENDLSQKGLEDYQTELQRLLKEKGDRLHKVERYISTIKNLSVTLGMDSSMIITKVHPSLNELSGLPKNINDGILAKLDGTVEFLEIEKHTRLEKLHQLGNALTNLWDLMNTPYADRQHFSHVMTLLSFSCAEISDPGSLTVDIIQQAETEVKRLDQLKASKMKELFLRKQMELQEICNKSHMEIPSTTDMEKLLDLINSGEMDHADILRSMDDHISKAEEEARSRKVIMEKMEKWILARDEERWLEEYSMDEKRYSVQRGAHKNLRRAERARVMVLKIPALVDMLIAKTKNWEEERNKVFLFDEVPLMEMLDQYNNLRKLGEDEKQRQRDMKKVQSQMELGQGNPLGSRPSTSSFGFSDINQNGGHTNTSPLNTRISMGSQQCGSLWNRSPSHEKSSIKAGKKGHAKKFYTRNGFPRHIKEDAISVVSSFPPPMSP